MKKTAQVLGLFAIVAVLFASVVDTIFAATTPWIPARSFTSPQEITNPHLAVDGDVSTYASIFNTTGIFGAWQFSNDDLNLPPEATITGYTMRLHTQNLFNQVGCTLVGQIAQNDFSNGIHISQFSFTDSDFYSTFEFSISPTRNSAIWNSSVIDIDNFSEWKVVRGITNCFVQTPRNYHEAFIQVEYTAPSPSPTPLPSPSPSPVPSPIPSPTPDPTPEPSPSPTPSPVPSPSVDPSPLPTPSVSPTPSPSPTPLPSSSPSPVPSPIPTPSSSPEPSPAPICKAKNAECKVNSSNKKCCAGLVCQSSGRGSEIGKCVEEEEHDEHDGPKHPLLTLIITIIKKLIR